MLSYKETFAIVLLIFVGFCYYLYVQWKWIHVNKKKLKEIERLYREQKQYTQEMKRMLEEELGMNKGELDLH